MPTKTRTVRQRAQQSCFDLLVVLALMFALPGLAYAQSDLHVVTAAYDIQLSSTGVPVTWRVYLPGERRGAAPTTTIETLDPPGTTNPQRTWRLTRSEDADSVRLRFASSANQQGVRVVRTWTFPKTGYLSRLDVSVDPHASDGAQRAGQGTLHAVRVGPGFSLGFGEAKSVPDGGEPDSRLIWRGHDGAPGVVDLSSPSVTLSLDATPFRSWVGVESQYSLLTLGPTEDGIVEAHVLAGADQAESDASMSSHVLIRAASVSRTSDSDASQVALSVFFGPKRADILKASGDGREDIRYMDLWGWMRALCYALQWLLDMHFELLGNWGLAIVALAVTMRLLLSPATVRSQRQQRRQLAAQARLKPELDQLKITYADDPERQFEETKKLYKAHDISMFAPLAGCMWVLMQLPIFIGMYFVISENFELREAGFLWLERLSEPDRLFMLPFEIPLLGSSFNLLPILMAGTQILSSSSGAQPGTAAEEPRFQKLIYIAVAISFFVLLYDFPSGLMLYWVMTNIGQLVQQRLVGMLDAAREHP